MMKHPLLVLVASLPLAAVELPPLIEAGPVQYNSVTYQPTPQAPACAPTPAEQDNSSFYHGTGMHSPSFTSPPIYATAPIQRVASNGTQGEVILNAYTTNYQVRGMGVVNDLSDHGWSSVSGSWTLPNRNLFNQGIHQRFSGTFGLIWGAGDALGDTPLANLNYALGKEVLPNLVVEIGYSFRRGGLEGFMTRATGGAHRVAQDFTLCASFNDQQRGFFGHILWGIGFQGLTGSYLDICAGYRLTDIASHGNYAADLELSAGVAPSFGYWGGGVEGIDAYRLRAALRPYALDGSFGRDARMQLTPWVQCSWTGNNSRKLDRRLGGNPADHFQLTFGADLGWKF